MPDDINPILKVKKLFPDAQLPTRAFETDSGLDLYAYKFEKTYTLEGARDVLGNPTEIQLPKECRVLINTGISATVGRGYEIQIRPRSGLALKKGLTVLNTPGTIDESYRGMIGVILVNLSPTKCEIKLGDRIAQMVVAPVVLCDTIEVENLSDTDRSSGGFGHSGE
jgi:dUTP pyrophosphatase